MWNKKGIIVSSQVDEGTPLYDSEFITEMALASIEGGAIGVRANGIADIAYIKEKTDVPVIGILKKEYPKYIPFITPTLEDALAVAYAGAEVIALDCTKNERPDGLTLEETIVKIKEKTNCKVMADISTIEEARYAAKSGVDYIGTTLYGYTKETEDAKLPGFSLIKKLVKEFSVPIIAEGGISTPEHVKRAFDLGVSWVVIGTAITNPMEITKDFVKVID